MADSDDDFIQPQPHTTSSKRQSFPGANKRKSFTGTQPVDKRGGKDKKQRAVSKPCPAAAAASTVQHLQSTRSQHQPPWAQERTGYETQQQAPRSRPCPPPCQDLDLDLDPEPTCPVCNMLLAAVSDTDTGRHAHVHACLERGACSPAPAPPRQPLQARSLNEGRGPPAMPGTGRQPDIPCCSVGRSGHAFPAVEVPPARCRGFSVGSPPHAPAAAEALPSIRGLPPAAGAAAGGAGGREGHNAPSLAPSASGCSWEQGSPEGVGEPEQGGGGMAELYGDDVGCGLSDGEDDVQVQQEWEAWYDDDDGYGGGDAEDGEAHGDGGAEAEAEGADLPDLELPGDCAAWGRGARPDGPGQLPGSCGADAWCGAGAGRAELTRTAEAIDLAGSSSHMDWLTGLGLPQYAELFEAAEVDEETLPHLRDEDLQELGIRSAHDRRTILQAAAAAALPAACDAAATAPGPSHQPPHQQPQSSSSAPGQAAPFVPPFSSLYNQSAQHPERSRITSYFKPHQPQPPRPAAPADHALRPLPQGPAGAGMRPIGFTARPQGSSAAAAAASTSAAMVGLTRPATGQQQRLGAPASAQPQPPVASTFAPQGPGLSRRVQRWHTIPGTRFLVDLFSPASRDIRGCDHWFLTHFHADHYKGLSKHFNQGVIVCSPVTAQLISTKLKVPWARIRAVALDTPTLIEGTTITLVEANHCPGAVMIAAEPPNGLPVLHTGDARLVPEMRDHATLQRLAGRSILVLDTTYCDPKYTFPSQKDTLKFTMDAIKSEKFNPRALFLFGTYTIGKERLFLEVARELGKKVYVCKEKMQTLQCCNLAPAYASLLTTNHLETNIHAVPLFKVNTKAVTEILAHYKGRYTSAVGVAPTGWSYEKEQHKSKGGRRVQRGGSSVIIYQVPYSEHSSFNELHDFVSWFKPIEILPSVGNDNGGPKVRQMRDLLVQPQPRSNQPTISSLFKNAASK